MCFWFSHCFIVLSSWRWLYCITTCYGRWVHLLSIAICTLGFEIGFTFLMLVALLEVRGTYWMSEIFYIWTINLMKVYTLSQYNMVIHPLYLLYYTCLPYYNVSISIISILFLSFIRERPFNTGREGSGKIGWQLKQKRYSHS